MLREVGVRDWDETLLSCGLDDVYLSRGFVRASAILDDAEPILLLDRGANGGVIFPLMLRSIPGEPGLADVVSPRGYGGPIGFGEAPPWSAFHDAYDRWCQQHRVVTTFIRFHPRYANQGTADPSMHVERLAGTIGWRITTGRDLPAQMHAHHRRSARIAERGGVKIVQGEPDAEGIARFRALYALTMRRVGATSYYEIPNPYWTNLQELGSRLILAEAFNEDGDTLSAALMLEGRPWLHYHLGGSTEEGRRVRANVLLFLNVAMTAQEHGFEVFHLGGGVRGLADSLLAFKRRFDPGGLLEVSIGKQIHDSSEYERMACTIETSGSFPRYRRLA